MKNHVPQVVSLDLTQDTFDNYLVPTPPARCVSARALQPPIGNYSWYGTEASFRSTKPLDSKPSCYTYLGHSAKLLNSLSTALDTAKADYDALGDALLLFLSFYKDVCHLLDTTTGKRLDRSTLANIVKACPLKQALPDFGTISHEHGLLITQTRQSVAEIESFLRDAKSLRVETDRSSFDGLS